MKIVCKVCHLKTSFFITLIVVAVIAIYSFAGKNAGWQAGLNGSYWSEGRSDTSYLIAISDNYFSYTAFNKAKKQFYFTWGGPLQSSGDGMMLPVEFNSLDSAAVGQVLRVQIQADQQGLLFFGHQYKRAQASPSALAGCWRIAGRMQDGKMTEMPLGPRRTLKLLTNNRFQWMAINIETGAFLGTGGGTYSFKDGKYTENIEFFSRDSTRVGQSLSFDAKVENGKWFHAGKSSKGDPISEVWVHLNED